MNEFDKLASQLFEEARRFLEKANVAAADSGKDAFLHAALLLAFSSLEAHVNAIAEELTMRPNLGVLDVSILSETDFSLDDNGRFTSNARLKMYRLEDRLLYIFSNFSLSSSIAPKASSWWSALKAASGLRNRLVHPKADLKIESEAVAKALEAILGCLNDLYQAVYARPFPTFKRGLNSKVQW